MINSEGNAVLVNVLSSAVRSTVNGMETAPALVRRTLEEGAWRRFTTPRGEEVEHNSFESFVTSAPTAGLGQTVHDLVRVIGDDRRTLGLLSQELGISVADLQASAVDSERMSPIDRDARHFGEYARAGGWLFGLMVARSVQPRKAGGRKGQKLGTGSESVSQKVTVADFAAKAGCSRDRVTRFYRAWERASSAGIVPSADELTPGTQIDLPESGLWSDYFVTYEQSSDRRESIARQADISGISYGQAVRIAEHPGALRTAILGDERTAEAACAALLDRVEHDEHMQARMAKAIAAIPEIKKAVSIESRKAEHADYVTQVVQQGKALTPSGNVIQLAESTLEKITGRLAEIGDPQSSPDAAKAAYSAVQEVVASAVQEDPEISSREQKAKLQKALSATSRSIDLIDPSYLTQTADEDIRASIASLQQKVNELANLVSEATPRRLRAV
ncbi:hypothetical protein V6U90_29755 [Micromonospora sp. CPCC 206060]|uniref:hypothetical protein n=1 Tax=Micromonospora sp. CPCC 206060 TaxID=3122406 RepID=UPI002FF2F180